MAIAGLVNTLKTRLEGRLTAYKTADLEPEFLVLADRCTPYTMTSLERLYGVHQAMEHIAAEPVDGDIVECGVWKGGSTMMACLHLLRAGDEARGVWLYDTFAGMPEPTDEDPEDAHREWLEGERNDHNEYCYSPLDEVRRNVLSTGIDAQRIRFVEGKVEDTIPAAIPDRIALLRLDTDWYESTRHELEHLWPRLQVGGVLIVDDYGHWSGARKAVDEYFAELGHRPLLGRLDYTGRMCIKTR